MERSLQKSQSNIFIPERPMIETGSLPQLKESYIIMSFPTGLPDNCLPLACKPIFNPIDKDNDMTEWWLLIAMYFFGFCSAVALAWTIAKLEEK